MIMNARMKDLLGDGEITARLDRIRLSPKLRELLKAELVEANGCYFLEPFYGANLATTGLRSTFQDRTGLECFVNHIHIEDLSKKRESLEILAQGVKFALQLEERLRVSGPFRIILSFDNSDDGISCIVRFHRIRPGEHWLSADLEGYKEEAILVLGTHDD